MDEELGLVESNFLCYHVTDPQMEETKVGYGMGLFVLGRTSEA